VRRKKKMSGSRARVLTGVSVLSTLALAVAACAPAASNNGGSSSDGDNQVITLGYIGALSGASATYGLTGLHGMELAIEQINASGEYPFQLKLRALDDKADPATSATLATQLVGEGVTAVIGGPNSGTVQANNPIITGAGIVQVIAIAQTDNLIDPDSDSFPLTFRITENNSYDVRTNVALLATKDYERICTLTDTAAYGQGMLQSIQATFDQYGLSIWESVQHQVNATDLTGQVLKLRDSGCEAVYLASLGADAALFLKTIKQLGWNVNVLGARGLATSSFILSSGADADGIEFPSTLDPSRPGVQEFIETYDAKYGSDDDPAHVFSSLGYDTIGVLAEALKISGGKGGEDLAKALESLTYTKGITGRAGTALSFSSTKHEAAPDNYLSFWALEQGRPVFVTADFEVSAQAPQN
jgi:branched-chain amino acid transport system substrate-binding protein